MMRLHDQPLDLVLQNFVCDWLRRLGYDTPSCGDPPSRTLSHGPARKYKKKYRAMVRQYERCKRQYHAQVTECLELSARNRALQAEIDVLKADLIASAARFTPKAFDMQCELHFSKPASD